LHLEELQLSCFFALEQYFMDIEMGKNNCEDCRFRAKYDKNPDSFLGQVWKWHIGWCPGWKKYFQSLPNNERFELFQQYYLENYM
jgi:hypothetical protein